MIRSLLMGPAQQLFFRAALGQAVLHLVGQHRPAEHPLGGLPIVQGVVAHADMGDQTVALQLPKGREQRARGNDGIRPMGLVEVDPIHTEAAQAGLSPLTDDGIKRRHREELGGNERLVPSTGDGLPDGSFRAAETVDLRGVDQVDPEVQRPLDDPHAFALGKRPPIPPLG